MSETIPIETFDKSDGAEIIQKEISMETSQFEATEISAEETKTTLQHDEVKKEDEKVQGEAQIKSEEPSPKESQTGLTEVSTTESSLTPQEQEIQKEDVSDKKSVETSE